MLEREIHFFKEHRQELATKHHGKFALVREDAIVGVFDSELAAYTEAKKKEYPAGSFLIQQCIFENEETPQVFHSRVHFPSRVS